MDEARHIIYDNRYSVHNEEIDNQHRKLFSIVNRLADISGSESSELLQVLNDLVDYLSVHFHSESMFMRAMNYPDFHAHAKEHDLFIKKVSGFLQDYEKQTPELTTKMLLFLREWVFTHTTRLDMKYADYFAGTRKDP